DLSEHAELVNSGIDHQYVDAPGLRLDGRVDAVEIREIGAIALNRCGIAADRGDCLIQLELTSASNKYARVFSSKAFGNAKADAGAAARHERDFACELAGHRDLLMDDGGERAEEWLAGRGPPRCGVFARAGLE